MYVQYFEKGSSYDDYDQYLVLQKESKIELKSMEKLGKSGQEIIYI